MRYISEVMQTLMIKIAVKRTEIGATQAKDKNLSKDSQK